MASAGLVMGEPSAAAVTPGGQAASCRYPGADPWRCRQIREATQRDSIAVLYPDGTEQGAIVYPAVLAGIEEQTQKPVVRMPVGATTDEWEVARQIEQKGIRKVIAVGRYGVRAANRLPENVEVVVGGVLGGPEAIAGRRVHSLVPEPAMLFELLKGLSPDFVRVFVVYDPARNTGLIRAARDAARSNGIELIAQEAGDLKQALTFYQANLTRADSKRDAIWLPHDPVTADEKTVLPFVLKEAWARNVVVFSSNAAHVRQGALFSVMPDSRRIGQRLGVLVQAPGPASERIVLMREAVAIMNWRTANLLGINWQSKKPLFDHLYPQQ